LEKSCGGSGNRRNRADEQGRLIFVACFRAYPLISFNGWKSYFVG
jgi:hypothetical protein